MKLKLVVLFFLFLFLLVLGRRAKNQEIQGLRDLPISKSPTVTVIPSNNQTPTPTIFQQIFTPTPTITLSPTPTPCPVCHGKKCLMIPCKYDFEYTR